MTRRAWPRSGWPLIGTGIVGASMLIGLVALGWRLASLPVQGTEGLVAQYSMFVAVFQGAVGLIVALATIRYVTLTGELVAQMYAERADAQRARVDEAVTGFIAAGLSQQRRRPRLPGSWNAAGGGMCPERGTSARSF